MGFFFGRKPQTIPKTAVFRLTQEGRDRLQQFQGDPKDRILMTLETRGTSDIDEIASSSGLSRGQVERFIMPMLRSGYVQFVSHGGGGGSAEVED